MSHTMWVSIIWPRSRMLPKSVHWNVCWNTTMWLKNTILTELALTMSLWPCKKASLVGEGYRGQVNNRHHIVPMSTITLAVLNVHYLRGQRWPVFSLILKMRGLSKQHHQNLCGFCHFWCTRMAILLRLWTQTWLALMERWGGRV